MTEFGVGTYTRNIVRALARLDHSNQYFLIGAPQKVAEIGPLPASFKSIALLDDGTTIKGYLERALARLDHSNQYFLIGAPQKVAEIGPLPASFKSIALLDDGTTIKGY